MVAAFLADRVVHGDRDGLTSHHLVAYPDLPAMQLRIDFSVEDEALAGRIFPMPVSRGSLVGDLVTPTNNKRLSIWLPARYSRGALIIPSGSILIQGV